MDSTEIRSPPTSVAIDARSSVADTTLSFPAPWQTPATVRSAMIMCFIECLLALERVRSMCPDRELELEQKLIGGHVLAVTSAAELTANLAELAGPVSEHE